jgi:apolipoprotein N-acyltransferase
MTLATQGIGQGKVDILHAESRTMPQSVPAKTSVWPCLAPALLSGVLLWMCFFPLAWGWWLGWVALVPLLSLARVQATPRRIYICAWIAGSVFFWPVLQWMRVADYRMYATWAMLAVYCALYFPVTLWLIRLLDRRTLLPLVFTVPVAWTAMEFVRSFLLTGFAWYYLGHTQHTMLSLIQIADLGGVYLISFLVAAVNAWLFDLLYQFPGLRDACRWEEPTTTAAYRPRADGWLWRPGLKYEAGLLLVAFVCTLIYGAWRLGQNQFQQGPLVALLQTNLDQRIRNEATDPQQRAKATAELVRHYATLCRKAMDHYPRPDLVIWPETSYPSFWLEASPRLPLERIPDDWRRDEIDVRRHLTQELLAGVPAHHLLGMSAIVLDENLKQIRYNSALHLHKEGRFGGRYDKMHRVPFGEYVPLRWLPFMDLLAPYDFDYSIHPGETFTRFELNKYKFGVLICYEDTDPFLARSYVRDENDGPPVDFLVNISNDGWFDGTSEHDEHLAISRFRAIECRRAVARSVNMGISAVIDGNGRVLLPQEVPPPGEPHTWKVYDDEELPVAGWRNFKKTGGVLLAWVPIDTRDSFYAAAGDWLPGACWALIGATILWSLVQRWRVRKTSLSA